MELKLHGNQPNNNRTHNVYQSNVKKNTHRDKKLIYKKREGTDSYETYMNKMKWNKTNDCSTYFSLFICLEYGVTAAVAWYASSEGVCVCVFFLSTSQFSTIDV